MNPWPRDYRCNAIPTELWSHFIAQLVEHRTGNREVTGSNPVEVLNFFKVLFTKLHKLRLLRRSFFSFSKNLLLNRTFSKLGQWQVKNAHGRTCNKTKVYIYLYIFLRTTFLNYPMELLLESLIRRLDPSLHSCKCNEQWIHTRGSHEISDSSFFLNLM